MSASGPYRTNRAQPSWPPSFPPLPKTDAVQARCACSVTVEVVMSPWELPALYGSPTIDRTINRTRRSVEKRVGHEILRRVRCSSARPSGVGHECYPSSAHLRRFTACVCPGLDATPPPYGLQGRARTIFSWVFLCGGIVGALATFLGTTRPYDTAAAASREHRYRVVAGPVTDFVPMPYTGHQLETFVVGRKFAYSDYVLTGCFNNTASHGGPDSSRRSAHGPNGGPNSRLVPVRVHHCKGSLAWACSAGRVATALI